MIHPSLRTNGSGERAPDDGLREAIQKARKTPDCFVAGLLAMTTAHDVPVAKF
jgi:hypothetical protein